MKSLNSSSSPNNQNKTRMIRLTSLMQSPPASARTKKHNPLQRPTTIPTPSKSPSTSPTKAWASTHLATIIPPISQASYKHSPTIPSSALSKASSSATAFNAAARQQTAEPQPSSFDISNNPPYLLIYILCNSQEDVVDRSLSSPSSRLQRKIPRRKLQEPHHQGRRLHLVWNEQQPYQLKRHPYSIGQFRRVLLQFFPATILQGLRVHLSTQLRRQPSLNWHFLGLYNRAAHSI